MIIVFNLLISLIGIIIILYFLEKDLSLFLMSTMIFVQYIWMFFSIVVIESGIYVVEQGRNGFFVGSSMILLLFLVSTIFSLIFFKRIFKNTFSSIKPTKFSFFKIKEEKLILFFLILIYFLAYLNLLLSPIPFFSKTVTKFNFWDTAMFPSFKSIVGNVMAFAIFGTAILYKYYKKISIFFFFLYVVYLVLMGQKFTGFFIGIVAVLIGFYFTSEKTIKFKIKWIFNKYLITFFLLSFLLVWYKYSLNNNFRNLNLTPLEGVFYRTFGLQAHVFWGTTEQYVFSDKPNSWNITELWKGMHHLMLEFWPWSYRDYISVTSRGVSWTNAYPSILLRIFPLPLALFINFILLSFLALIQELLSLFIKGKALILSIIVFQLLIWTSYTYTMAYFSKLLIPVIFVTFYFLYKYFLLKSKEN